jgi:hypothetical protein
MTTQYTCMYADKGKGKEAGEIAVITPHQDQVCLGTAPRSLRREYENII